MPSRVMEGCFSGRFGFLVFFFKKGGRGRWRDRGKDSYV